MKSNSISLIIILILVSVELSSAQSNKDIELISPNGYYELKAGRREGISWICRALQGIDIEYSLDQKKWHKIFSNIQSDIEVLSWKVPDKLNGSDIKIRIIDHFSKEILDETVNWITVSGQEFNANSNLSQLNGNVLKILPLGNSITFDNRSGDIRPIPDKIGYRYPLYQYLLERGIEFDFIGSESSGSNYLPSGYEDNAGFPGITDDQLVTLLETGILNMPRYGVLDTITDGPYLETYLPDIILLHIGTNGNDLFYFGTLPDEVEDILNEINRVEALLNHTIEVIVARIIDRVPNQSYVTTFNNNVEEMILDRIYNPQNDAYPDNISIVDMQKGAGILYEMSPDPNGTPGNMNDGLHPNDSGYIKMAGKWFTQINSLYVGCADNRISSWNFDGNTPNTIIDRLELNPVNYSNSPIKTEGMKGSSLFFNGTDELTIPNSYSLNYNLNGSFSVELWIQTQQSGSGNKVFIGKYNGANESTWWLGMNSDIGTAKFSVRSSAGDDNSVAQSTSIINDGKWHHVVGVKDVKNSTLKLYVDGELEDAEATNFSGQFIGDADLTIGAYVGDFNFIGNLDELTIYDRELSENQVNDNYQHGRMKLTDCNESVVSVSIKVFIEGSYNLINNELMVNSISIPIYHPFMNSNWNYNGPEAVSSLPNNEIVDWILISLRTEINAPSTSERRAAFLKKDGSVVDLDGISDLQFTVDPGEYYIVIEHRNHLPIMTSAKVLFQ